MRLTNTQQEFMESVRHADKYDLVAYFEFGMYKGFYRRTCDSLVKKGLIEYVDSTWHSAWVRLVKEEV